MARSMWKGAIQFGLVTIPVKLYLATESELHDPLQHAPREGPVADPDEDLVPGRGRGDHLARRHRQGLRVRARPVRRDHRRGPREGPAQDGPLDRDRAVRDAPTTRTPSTRSSSSRPTTSSPTRSAARRSTCSGRSSRSEGLTAICKVVIQDREALAALDPFEDTMLLTTLHWPDEIRSTKELDLPDEDVRVQARRAQDGRAARRGDDRRRSTRRTTRTSTARRCMKVIEAKVEGVESRGAEQVEESAQPRRPHGRARGSVKAAKPPRESEGQAGLGRRGEGEASRPLDEGRRRGQEARGSTSPHGGERGTGGGRVGQSRPPAKERLMPRCP